MFIRRTQSLGGTYKLAAVGLLLRLQVDHEILACAYHHCAFPGKRGLDLGLVDLVALGRAHEAVLVLQILIAGEVATNLSEVCRLGSEIIGTPLGRAGLSVILTFYALSLELKHTILALGLGCLGATLLGGPEWHQRLINRNFDVAFLEGVAGEAIRLRRRVLVEQALEHLAQLRVLGLVLETVGEDFFNERGQLLSAGFSIAEVTHGVSKLGVANVAEAGVSVSDRVNLDVGESALAHQVDEQIAQRDEVITAAGREEL